MSDQEKTDRAVEQESRSLEDLKVVTSNFITRTKYFQRLCKYVFTICDSNKTGSINETELYAGVLLVHLTLAKYAGPAACYPASRQAVEKLFTASDEDDSGGIDEEEFETIAVITAASISSRILTYYAILIIVVPYLAARVINVFEFFRVDDGILVIDSVFDKNAPDWMQFIVDVVPDSYWLRLPEQLISLGFFFFVIPRIFDTIDKYLADAARANVVHARKVE